MVVAALQTTVVPHLRIPRGPRSRIIRIKAILAQIPGDIFLHLAAQDLQIMDLQIQVFVDLPASSHLMVVAAVAVVAAVVVEEVAVDLHSHHDQTRGGFRHQPGHLGHPTACRTSRGCGRWQPGQG